VNAFLTAASEWHATVVEIRRFDGSVELREKSPRPCEPLIAEKDQDGTPKFRRARAGERVPDEAIGRARRNEGPRWRPFGDEHHARRALIAEAGALASDSVRLGIDGAAALRAADMLAGFLLADADGPAVLLTAGEAATAREVLAALADAERLARLVVERERLEASARAEREAAKAREFAKGLGGAEGRIVDALARLGTQRTSGLDRIVRDRRGAAASRAAARAKESLQRLRDRTPAVVMHPLDARTGQPLHGQWTLTEFGARIAAARQHST